MTARELADSLCKDVVRDVYEEDGHAIIETTLPYPTGDLITLRVIENGGDDRRVSDDGMTAYWLAVDGVQLTEPRRRLIESACLLHDVVFDGETFTRRFTHDTLGGDVLALCQAIARVSTLRYDRTGRTPQTLADEVASLVDSKVLPYRSCVADWTDAKRDPKTVNVVDYHFNAKGVPSNLFIAQSRQRVEVVTSIIWFWRSQFSDFKSICVVPDEMELSKQSRERLRMAANDVVNGVGRNEARIVDFALSESAYVPPPMGRPTTTASP